MKIYCSCCDKVQLVRIDNCRDAKTNEPYQDIVCNECHLVIASGTDIKREWVGLNRMELIKCGVLPFGNSYALYEAIEAALRSKNG